MSIDLKQLQPFMKPFPEGNDIFSNRVEQHLKHIQPLLTIELSAIKQGWSGTLHFLTPKEPYEGLVGQSTSEFHNYYSRENCIAFRVDNDKYVFLGDFRYFELETQVDAGLIKHYQEVELSLAATKSLFEEHHFLNPWGQLNNPQDWLDELGGEPWCGNWSDSFPNEIVNDEFCYPLTEDGRRFEYIGSLSGYSYRENAADGVLLFFDPVEKIALFIFDWT